MLPSSFNAHVTHYQSAIRLPEGCHSLAQSDMEPHHAFRLGEWMWGIQFHPEFDEAVIQGYLDERDENIGESRYRRLSESVTSTPESTSLLPQFCRLVTERKGQG